MVIDGYEDMIKFVMINCDYVYVGWGSFYILVVLLFSENILKYFVILKEFL